MTDKKTIKRIIENLRLNGFDVDVDQPDKKKIYRVGYTESKDGIPTKTVGHWNMFASELESFWWGINALWNANLKELKTILTDEYGYPAKIEDISIQKRKE